MNVKPHIPFVSFESTNKTIRSEVLQNFEQFFDKAWYVLGDQLQQFEKEYASFNEVSHSIGISNGLDALHIALKALGIGEGDEVIVPSNTFIATVLAVSYVGAKPVFVEPNIHTYNIDPAKIEAAITSRTKAIMPVHLYGQICEMAAIEAIAQKHKLYIIEDNAQAQGASYRGKISGSWGHINATSFYPGKNLGALGDAGGITTNDEVLAQKAKTLRNYGSQKKYYHEEIGFNMRMDECQAGFLAIKLKYLQQWNKQRGQIAEIYANALKGVGDVILPQVAKDADHVYHLFVIRTKQRDKLQEYLTGKGIGTLIHYPVPPHLQAAYKDLGYKMGDLPIAEEIAGTCLSLPVWPGLSEGQVIEVSNAIRDFFNGK
ncbi:aminotransferase [Niastella koreensis]|uniref:Glutamine--scyllo-inositol transaminase n=2 Tax=Niastella koreensis TaxID=354356 RepID=G8TLB0_NIAKG|nr:DegT/DnrJ/EryC1/StrS family aminotransferase [Niastella koreensis]AEW02983.1 Glutamine--scyllo-inositol transaminase [Niastella koreensis GR20-10]OQP55298.1 aminotransferase [Niastella koreensis]